MDRKINGSKTKAEIRERNETLPCDGLFVGIISINATHGPIGNHNTAIPQEIIQVAGMSAQVQTVLDALPQIEAETRAKTLEVECN